MAKKEREEVELAFNLELETRKAARGLALIEKTIRKTASRKIELDLDKKSFLNFKKGAREYKKELDSIQKVIKEVGGDGNYNKATANLGKLQDAHTKFEKTLRNETLKMAKGKQRFKERMAKADNELVKRTLEKQFKNEQRSFKKKILEARKDVIRERRTMAKNVSGGAGSLIFEKHAEMTDKRRKDAEAREQGLADMKTAEIGRDLGESFADTVQSLAGKDLLGIAKGGTKLSANLLKGAGKYGMIAGRNLQIKGMGMGGAAGGAMAGVGKMLSNIGPLVQTLSKLGVVLGGAVSAFGAIFKMILDIESAGKEMNKQILEGASTAESFAAAGGKADRAYNRLSTTLDDVRAQATSLENVKWGLKAEDVIRVTNAMAQQGVTLSSLQKGFKNAGNEARGFGDMARMSLAYSRLMGVSLQEITDFQAEMFTELGQSLSSVRLGYARMTKDATESGIASNKFFAIIRSVSSDLGLYTTRLEQASTMLKLLGKVMNPREAQKFMSAATQGFKAMGEEDRLRATLLAGEGRMRGLVSDDLERKTKLLYNDIAKGAGVAFEDVVKAAREGKGELDKILSKVADNQRGALESALAEISLDSGENRAGTMGTANAAANLSMGGVFEATKAALQRIAGNKKLKDMVGIEGYAARKAAGVSMDQFRGMVKLESAIDAQRQEMVAALKEPTKNPDLVDRLKALDINLENIFKKGDADIIAAMTTSDQEALVDAVEQTNYAQKTMELTTTLTDKMGIVVDGIFNYLYVALKDLISVIHSIFDWMVSKFGGSKTVDPRVRQETIKSAALAVQQGWESTVQSGDMAGMVARDLGVIFDNSASAGKSGLEKQLADSTRLTKISTALENAGITGAKKDNFLSSIKDGSGSFTNAMDAAGLTPEEMRKLLDKSLYTVRGDKLDTLSKLETVGGRAIADGRSPSLTQASARAAEGMGQQGASASASTVGASAPLVTQGNGMVASPITGATMPLPSEGHVLAEQVDMMGRENVQSLQNLYDALRRRGIVLDKTQLQGPVKDVVRQGTLEAFREALMEHALYTSSNPTATLQRMKDSGFSGVSSMATSYEELHANASGGHVVGVADGKAVIAARGEGLASVGKGEKIVPSGAGGGNITVNVNGIGGADLANHLRKKIAEGIYEYKRREKFQ